MVISSLDEKLIKSGERLIQLLDTESIVVDAALWLYFPDNQNWKLLLSFPTIISQGPKAAYEKVQDMLSGIGDIAFSLDDVAIAKDDDPLLNLMRTAIDTGPGISGIRFSNNVINGQLIQDAYIYRLVRVTKNHSLRTTAVFDKAVKYSPIDAAPKVSRNDPCPCGSGKKYKKCHGA